MKCKNCGAELLDGAMFCSVCGSKVEPVRQSAADNKQKTGDNQQSYEVELNPVDRQPVASDPEPEVASKQTIVNNRQPSDYKQPIDNDDQRTRIYYGDSGNGANKYGADPSLNNSQFSRSAMSGGTVAVAQKKSDNKFVIIAFIGGCVLISMLAFILIFVSSCRQSPIEGRWMNSSGKVIRFEKNGEFTWDDKYGTYTFNNESFLTLQYKNYSDLGETDIYIFDQSAIKSSGDYWYVSGNMLYISGVEYIKIS